MINPRSSINHKWILTTIDYFTRWTEVVPLQNSIEMEIVSFLKGLVMHFCSPKTIISNNARAFTGSKVAPFSLDHNIYLETSLNYYPQGNGLVESTNKNPIRLIKRIGAKHKREWHCHLRSVLLVERVTTKQVLKNSPYKLVYGKEAHFPISSEIPTLQLLKSLELEGNEPMEVRLV